MTDSDDDTLFTIDLNDPYGAALAGNVIPPLFSISEDVVQKYGDTIPKGGLLPNDLTGLGNVGRVAGPLFDIAARSDDGFTQRDALAVAGGLAAGEFVSAAGGAGISYLLAAGIIATGPAIGLGILVAGGAFLAGSGVSYLIDHWEDLQGTPSIAHLTAEIRQTRITSTDFGMQARYDSPQYDVQTADGKGVTRAYVDAYAQGDLKTAAQLLVGHGANIYPGAANGFYPDAIIRQVAAGQNHASPQPQKVKDAASSAAWQQEYNRDRQRGTGRHAARSVSARTLGRNSPIARQHRTAKGALRMKSACDLNPITGAGQGWVVKQGPHTAPMAARGVCWRLNGNG